MKKRQSLTCWGKYPHARQKGHALHWPSDPFISDSYLLPYGQGRSYGDSCLNSSGTLLLTQSLDRFIHFDETTGLLRAEAGIQLSTISHISVPKGWFLPVTPGTQTISLGGAIANDVHGKNHHHRGSFGRHVTCFALKRSDQSVLLCSATENADYFNATIGGLGLTGLMLWAEIKLIPIQTAFIKTLTQPFMNIDEFFQLSEEVSHHEYTVAWLDAQVTAKNFGRGILFAGDHLNTADPLFNPQLPQPQKRALQIPCNMPQFLLNKYTALCFNQLYFQRNRNKHAPQAQHYTDFFYPLDKIHHWNRLYGKRGLLQYQCALPLSQKDCLGSLLRTIKNYDIGTFLAVLKVFGDKKSPGLLSFPRPGVTLALDFPNNEFEVLQLLARLDRIVMNAGGAVYPAKDARMSPSAFQHFYPQWEAFAPFIDPQFMSDFWRRVTRNIICENRMLIK